MNRTFWTGKKVLLTGHTGFKGSWLSLWLSNMDAQVYGYALTPNTDPALFNLLALDKEIDHFIGDIRDLKQLKNRMDTINPDIVIHMAAQPLVRYSYDNPIETYETNVMGTVNLLEVVRTCPSVKVVINVTTDKCYENKEWEWAYRENEPMGGYDPYSNSKACSELVTSAYRTSYFNRNYFDKHGKAIASARAGNVIGGGDWALDRLIPDVIRSFINKQSVAIRYPDAIRPWQHVLEPLSGYLSLAEKLWHEPSHFAEAWNFGPYNQDVKTVKYIVNYLAQQWDNETSWYAENEGNPHEAHYLKLDIAKAQAKLGWQPSWSLNEALDATVAWYQAWAKKEDIYNLSLNQIETYENKLNYE